eukprot:gnl/MRDRNA2_/MRDRNA2_291565_c0_seq1.p1 gnl/MRDRNA2_/MRDRNA2_291565_c0~~gnl/MRDRNA2_/MRDRNA2_291565_c0_seq1.p1  ORF type:complete len:356 (+),score=62.74 gnl/MRDRNA2_/MRDRNA2_291565_c0_seq1:57-1070(+)
MAVHDIKSAGKRTLMRLIASDLHPNSGRILCPPNLRVALVEASPVLLPDDSLFNNAMAFAADWVTEGMCWNLVQDLGVRSLPELKARRALQKTGMIVSIARALLTDPDVLILLRARWPGGQWQEQVLKKLYQWQREGLHALLGSKNVETDDRRQSRTLILTQDEKDLQGIQVDHTFVIQTRSPNVNQTAEDYSRTAEGDIAFGLQDFFDRTAKRKSQTVRSKSMSKVQDPGVPAQGISEDVVLHVQDYAPSSDGEDNPDLPRDSPTPRLPASYAYPMPPAVTLAGKVSSAPGSFPGNCCSYVPVSSEVIQTELEKKLQRHERQSDKLVQTTPKARSR